MPRPTSDAHPAVGWGLVAFAVLVFDAVNVRSLTSHARAHRLATWLAGGVVLSHLVGVLPARVDPFEHLARFVRP